MSNVTGQGGSDGGDRRNGILAALGAYGVWGFFPVLFHALDAVSPLMIVGNRIVWSFLLVGGILWNRGRLEEVRAAITTRRVATSMVVSAVLLAINWLVFVWAVHQDEVLAVSFGYFINPLVSVAIGFVLLGERLNTLQWLAIGVAAIGVGVQALGVGGLPIISLALAFSFGFYGYFRKTANVGSAPGLFVETLVLLPVAAGYLVWTLATTGPGAYADGWLFFLLVMTGPATSGALILFAYATRRLRLSSVGMFQYLAPSLQFLLAIWLYGEPLNFGQLVSFALIWVSLGIYSYDLVNRRPRKRQATDGRRVAPGENV